MLQMVYTPSQGVPCLFYKEGRNCKPKSFIIIYVDDGDIISDEVTIQQVLKELGKTFKVKSLGILENSIVCKLIENEAKDTIWIHQPKLFTHLEQTFGSFIIDNREYKIPAAPGTTIMCPQAGHPLISQQQQKLTRSGMVYFI